MVVSQEDKVKAIKVFGDAKSFAEIKKKINSAYMKDHGTSMDPKFLNSKAREYWQIAQIHKLESALPKINESDLKKCEEYKKISAKIKKVQGDKKQRVIKDKGPRKDQLVELAQKNKVDIHNKGGKIKSKAAIKSALTKAGVKL